MMDARVKPGHDKCVARTDRLQFSNGL